MNAKILAEFTCPWCGKDAQMINEDELGYAVLHVEPRCAEFEAMDPLTYVTEARKLKEKQLKERMPKA